MAEVKTEVKTDVQLTQDELQAAVQKAIWDALSPEKRDKLFQDTLQKLLTEKEYGTLTRLERAVESVFNQVARQAAEELILNDERIMGQLRKVIAEAAERALFANKEKVIETVEGAVRKGLFGERW